MEQEVINKVKQARKGDKEALIQLIMSQKQDYYRLAYVYVKDQEDAEAFFSWRKTILVNCYRQNLRKKNKVILLQELELPEESYEELISEHEEQMVFEAHLDKLNSHYQEVLRLRFLGAGEEIELDVETMTYGSIYNEVINIPLD